MNLNDRAAAVCRSLLADTARLRVEVSMLPSGTRIVDCGVAAIGGLEAGLLLARVCLADLGRVEIEPLAHNGNVRPAIVVQTDHPRLACMASQYAGWEVKGEKYFAMGSGPMRAAAAREPLFEQLGYRESPAECVGVLETARLPTDEVATTLAEKCGVAADRLTLLVAPTRSLAGTGVERELWAARRRGALHQPQTSTTAAAAYQNTTPSQGKHRWSGAASPSVV